jgi:predicted DNA-binding transcriptional regulator AlpA
MNVHFHQKQVTIFPGERLSRRDAAAYLGRTYQTLYLWEKRGHGPTSVKIGARSFYTLSALDAFIAASNATGAGEGII